MRESKCLYCGCTESDPCVDAHSTPCHWVVIDPVHDTGICSNCAEVFNLRISISIENVEHITQIINLRDR